MSLLLNMPTLIRGGFYVLLKGSITGCYCIRCSLLRDHFGPCLIHISTCTSAVIKRRITSRSIVLKYSSDTITGDDDNLRRAPVSSGIAFHTDQDDLLPCPTNADVVSHPIKA